MAHRIPNGDPAEIVERALAALLEQTRKERTAATEKPRRKPHAPATESGKRSRYVPADVRREVWARDGGRCTFVSEDGRRCEETRGLELGHRRPWAKGGENTADELALECRAHNRYAAHVEYGRDFVEEKVRQRREGVREAEASNARQPVASNAEHHRRSPRRALRSADAVGGVLWSDTG
jgi:5-methylcytosine-specific restriction endonuclease McrA